MIKISGLTKRFDGFAALKDLNMTVPKGSVYGIVGPNGSGKTTALRHIVGIYRQDEGEVLVFGEPVWDNPAVKARIGYIPDDIFYFHQSSIRDMARFYNGIFPTFDKNRFKKLEEAFNLPLNKPIRSFSKGQQKQAAFWLQMSLRPDLLVLDEPVDGLDPVMRRQVWSLIMADAAERGMTVLVSSHNLRELEDVCDHVGILNKGHLLLERSLNDLQENIIKIQLALPEGSELPPALEIVHEEEMGRLKTLIVRGDPDETMASLKPLQPILMECVPLTLEEIFIYELGGKDYAVKDILL